MRFQNGDERLNTIIPVRITPRAQKNEISELMEDGTVKIRLTAPPIDGKANKALVDFLSDILNVRRSSIEIISGMKSRNKQVRITGFGEHTLYRSIMTLLSRSNQVDNGGRSISDKN